MGYSEKELLQKHFQSLIHPEDGARNLDFVRRLMAGDIPSFEMENRYVRKDGTTARVHRFVSVLRDDKGNPVNLMALVSDVTKQRNAEEKTHRERERLRRMVDTAQVGIVILSPEGEVREANDALLRMIGWTREEFATRGLHWRKLTPPEYWDLDRKTAAELLRRGSAEPAERMIFRKDGTRIPVLCNGVMLPGDQGQEFAVFVTDLTEQRRLEGALQDAGQAAQDRIARDLHDGLGQQLGGALYLGRLLQRDLKARSAPEAARAAELNSLVKDAIDLTRHVARGLNPVPAQPDGLMLALQALIEQVARGAKATLVFECQPPVLFEDVRIASHLYRIAQEAINNALKHSHATRIEVALWRESAALYLAVRDNGIGLAHGPAGHGLGMHTMKHRSRLVGGLLTIENASDGGAKITCQVPLPFPTPHTPKAPALNPESVAGPKQREDGSPLTHSSPQPIP
jgi:PAS domain S-box-containing protein